jgi:hypothetical protein
MTQLHPSQYTTAFQAEVHAIKACAADNTDTSYKSRIIHILTVSQEAIKALDNYQINSQWVWDFHQSLVKLAEHTRVQLIRVSCYRRSGGNEIAHELERMGSQHQHTNTYTGPELACGSTSCQEGCLEVDEHNRTPKRVHNTTQACKRRPSAKTMRKLLEIRTS